MKILISYIAFNNDFMKDSGEVNKTGTTYSFYRDVYKKEGYGKHYLLVPNIRIQNTERRNKLIACLKTDFPDLAKGLDGRELEIHNIIDHEEILGQQRKFLMGLELEEDISSLDIFISPGTPAMQVAWILASIHSKLPLRLIQTTPAQYAKSGKTEVLPVNIDLSGISENVIRKDLLTSSSIKPKKNEKIKFTPSILKVYERAKLVASTPDITTWIRGETGAGKENLARFIHEKSSRATKPFRAINCSALGDELLESRLFGHKKGAFTGAIEDHKGLFEECDGGTIFLDEIGDISPKMQQSLLRVLQEKMISPIGKKDVKVDVRVITATHQDLAQKAAEGTFRWDLYYRLNVVELKLPSFRSIPLSERKDLLYHFLKSKKNYFNRKQALSLSKEAEHQLLEYDFPGNIRELENIVLGLYVFNETGVVELEELPDRVVTAVERNILEDQQDYVLHKHYQKVYHKCGKSKKKAYERIGVSQNTFEKYFNFEPQ